MSGQRERSAPALPSRLKRPALTDAGNSALLTLRQHEVQQDSAMNDFSHKTPAISAPAAAAISSCAFAVPLALSISSTPSPNHPGILLWYKSLREPRFKPPDALIPLAWGVIEAALALAGYRLLRAPRSASRSRALALWGWNVGMIGGWNRFLNGITCPSAPLRRQDCSPQA